jgi:tRNA threonylcarbamoyladenosine biosynthesis protein TsaE
VELEQEASACKHKRGNMRQYEVKLITPAVTENFGCRLGRIVLPGDVICLDGELGTGKTTLTQAIAKGLDVPSSCYVTSPSFAILHEYIGRIPMYHMDFYRMSSSAEVEDQGLEEYFYSSGVTVIEWSRRAMEILPIERLGMHLRIDDDDAHVIRCTYMTNNWEKRIAALFPIEDLYIKSVQ